MKRVATAAVLAPLLWALLYFGPMWAFCALVVLVMTGAMLESYGIFAARGAKPLRWLGVLIALGVAASFTDYWGPEAGSMLPAVFVFGALLVITAAMWLRREPEAMLDAVLATLFPVLFVGLTLTHLIGLRLLGEETGRDLIFLLCLCVMLGDTAAYYVGSSIGRHRMAPKLSPSKSWEGAIASLVAAVGAGWLAKMWFYPELPLSHALILGGLLGVAGILGDLSESMLKRAGGVKDASNLLPGHGGLLDRVDSLLFAAPLLYYYSRAFLPIS